MNRPLLWIALNRPDNLVNALAVAKVGRERFAGCHLLYEHSAWWTTAGWEEFRSFFDEVHTVEKVPTCRGLRDIPRFYRGLKARQRQLVEMQIGPADTIVTLAGITVLSNALASAYPRVRKVLCTTVQRYLDASRPYSFRHYRHTTSGWLQYRFLEPWTGLRRTVHLKPWWGGGDGIRLERLADPLETVFEAILLMSNEGTELPANAGRNVHPARFPSVNELGVPTSARAGEGQTSRKIVFFGTPFLLVRNLAPEVYAARLNDCLAYLRRSYGEHCQFVYRPHPAETAECGMLRLDGFAIEEDRQVAELYFLKQRQCIEAVFSVSSTVSRVAYNFGLNGYALWRCFPFDAAAAAYFEKLMGRVPDGFEVRSLEQPPLDYAAGSAAARNGSLGFQEAIASILDSAGPVGTTREKPVAASLGSPV